jgi:hypothetical protein
MPLIQLLQRVLLSAAAVVMRGLRLRNETAAGQHQPCRNRKKGLGFHRGEGNPWKKRQQYATTHEFTENVPPPKTGFPQPQT